MEAELDTPDLADVVQVGAMHMLTGAFQTDVEAIEDAP
jgi:hypothetical protein